MYIRVQAALAFLSLLQFNYICGGTIQYGVLKASQFREASKLIVNTFFKKVLN